MCEYNMPKVSVIIPVYNSEKYLHQCLDTICAQTLKEIEIICVDDGSADNSVQIIEEYASRDVRVKILHHPHCEGGGAAGARNMGMEVATGEYLIFLDSDDYFATEMLESVYDRAKICNADVVTFDAQKFDSSSGKYVYGLPVLKKEYIPKQEVFSWKEHPDYLLQAFPGSPWMHLFRREHVSRTSVKFQKVYYTDDLFFVFTVIAEAERVTVVDKKLLYYRVNNSGSQTENMTKAPNSLAIAYIALKNEFEKREIFELFRRSFINRAAVMCRWYLHKLSTVEAFSILYNFLKNNALEEMSMLQATKQDYYDVKCYEWVRMIYEMDELQYMHKYFYDYWEAKDKAFDKQLSYKFCNQFVKASDRVVLYGAGVMGKSYFMQNLTNKYCDIVQWVDKDYEKFSSQIKNPECIGDKVYDKVIVAVENHVIYEQIKTYLINKGICEEKIIWPFQERK